MKKGRNKSKEGRKEGKKKERKGGREKHTLVLPSGVAPGYAAKIVPLDGGGLDVVGI